MLNHHGSLQMVQSSVSSIPSIPINMLIKWTSRSKLLIMQIKIACRSYVLHECSTSMHALHALQTLISDMIFHIKCNATITSVSSHEYGYSRFWKSYITAFNKTILVSHTLFSVWCSPLYDVCLSFCNIRTALSKIYS